MTNFSGATTAINSIENISLIQTAATTNVNIINKTIISSNAYTIDSVIISIRPTTGILYPR